MNFNQTLEYLLSLGHETLAIKLGLRNVELLLKAIGNPERSYTSVQIAGTNGKGSTAVVLDSICRASGIKTGLYTSPHLTSITERIKIHGTDIAEEEFARLATAVRTVADQLLIEKELRALPTFFEHTTAIALLAFKEAQVEVAVLETGLGGRLDATTVAGAPIVGITQIAVDHEEYLGSDLTSIATEKAAIIREGVDVVVVADHQPQEALSVIKERCEQIAIEPAIGECAVKLNDVCQDGRFCVTFTTKSFSYEGLKLGLRGEHQIDNVALAIQLGESVCNFKSDEEALRAVREGVASARHPGRLESISAARDFLFDGAHNTAGARTLRQHLTRFVKAPLTVIFAAMQDKQLEEMGALIFPLADRLILTSIDSPRTADPDVLLEIAQRHLQSERIAFADSADEAMRLALDQTPETGVVCVTGSLYLIGELRPIILATQTSRLRTI